MKKYPNHKKDKDDFNKSIIHLSFEQDLIHNPDPGGGSYLIVKFCIRLCIYIYRQRLDTLPDNHEKVCMTFSRQTVLRRKVFLNGKEYQEGTF